jgi:ribonuclease BN (tRNA processing enzyme)
LILDAGIRSKEIKQALNFDFSNVRGVLITHNHGDHSLSADDLELLGLDVFRPYLVDSCMDRRTFGEYAVSSFPVEHDGEPCSGFLIRHINGFRMIYVTDLSYCKYTFRKQKVDAILVEVNYQTKYAETLAANYAHKIRGHFSLENCIEFLKANQTEKLRTVVICHTSDMTMDLNECLAEIQKVVGNGVKVYAARKGTEIEL